MDLRTGSPRHLLALGGPVALCILAIVLSLAFVRGGARDDGGSPPGGTGVNVPSAAAGATEEDDGEDGERSAIEDLAERLAQDDETVREVLNAEASPSGPDTFLDDLSEAGEPVAAVGWTDGKGLEHAGRGVLEIYRQAGASLQMHGFLDLHGTAWAAVLQGDGWVDVISVAGPHEDAASVRVARIAAG